MVNLHLILYIIAFVLFLLAGLGVQAGRYNLIGFGLAAWVATLIF